MFVSSCATVRNAARFAVYLHCNLPASVCTTRAGRQARRALRRSVLKRIVTFVSSELAVDSRAVGIVSAVRRVRAKPTRVLAAQRAQHTGAHVLVRIMTRKP